MPQFNYKANTPKRNKNKQAAMLKRIKKQQPGRHGNARPKDLPRRMTIQRTVRRDIEG